MPAYGSSYCVFCRGPVYENIRGYARYVEIDTTPFEWLDTGLILLYGDREPEGVYYTAGLSHTISVIDKKTETYYYSYKFPEPMFLHQVCYQLLQKWDKNIAIRHGYSEQTGGLIYYALSRRKEDHICDQMCQYYRETEQCQVTRYIDNQECQCDKFYQFNQMYLLENPHRNSQQQRRLLTHIRHLFRKNVVKDWFEHEQFIVEEALNLLSNEVSPDSKEAYKRYIWLRARYEPSTYSVILK